jgi:hypothetical protein
MSVTKGVIHQIVELNERPIKVIVQVSPIVSKFELKLTIDFDFLGFEHFGYKREQNCSEYEMQIVGH